MFLTFATSLIIALACISALIQVIYNFRYSRKPLMRFEVVRGAICITLLTISLFSLCTGWLIRENSATIVIGYSLLLLGLCLRIWAQITIRSNWSVGVIIRNNHRLITSGPYKPFRHPMYDGYGLIGIGMIVLTSNLLFALGWLFFFFLLFQRAMEESRQLQAQFPGEFEEWSSDSNKLFPRFFLALTGGYQLFTGR